LVQDFNLPTVHHHLRRLFYFLKIVSISCSRILVIQIGLTLTRCCCLSNIALRITSDNLF
jgi:hypothetical protein